MGRVPVISRIELSTLAAAHLLHAKTKFNLLQVWFCIVQLISNSCTCNRDIWTIRAVRKEGWNILETCLPKYHRFLSYYEQKGKYSALGEQHIYKARNCSGFQSKYLMLRTFHINSSLIKVLLPCFAFCLTWAYLYLLIKVLVMYSQDHVKTCSTSHRDSSHLIWLTFLQSMLKWS